MCIILGIRREVRIALEDAPAVFLYVVAKSWRAERPTMELMYLIKYTSSDGQVKYYRLIDRIQEHWRDIGILMGIEPSVLNNVSSIWKGNLREQCREVLQTWNKQGSEKYPVTWSGMLGLLEDLQLKEISRELQEALGKQVYFLCG